MANNFSFSLHNIYPNTFSIHMRITLVNYIGSFSSHSLDLEIPSYACAYEYILITLILPVVVGWNYRQKFIEKRLQLNSKNDYFSRNFTFESMDEIHYIDWCRS